nr:hypothetical protein [Streptomyces olivaceus]
MHQLPVGTSAATAMVAKNPQPKVCDRRTGEIATDAETSAKLMTVDVMFAANNEVEIFSVTVPETGIPGELTMGTPAALTGLVARPWENDVSVLLDARESIEALSRYLGHSDPGVTRPVCIHTLCRPARHGPGKPSLRCIR